MKTLFVVSLSLLAINAQAGYQPGTYHCKSSGGENVYSVRNVNVGGVDVPYVEATLHYHQGLDPNSPVVESVVKGFAADSSTGAGTTLMVAALRLEFENGSLLNCKQ